MGWGIVSRPCKSASGAEAAFLSCAEWHRGRSCALEGVYPRKANRGRQGGGRGKASESFHCEQLEFNPTGGVVGWFKYATKLFHSRGREPGYLTIIPTHN